MKIIKSTVILCLVVAVLLTTFSGCNSTASTNSSEPNISSEKTAEATITVKIIGKNSKEKSLEIKTNAPNLGEALFEEGLVTESEYKSGYYTVIDGVSADYNKDKAWWCFTKGGKEVMVGANDLEIENGDTFEITYTPA